jgi:hypothetical protein
MGVFFVCLNWSFSHGRRTRCLLRSTNLLLGALVLTASLAHALEFPGKMLLNKDNYLATQAVYCPGFTMLAERSQY